MAKQERRRVKRFEKKEGGKYTSMCGHNECGICTVNMGFQTFVKGSPQDPPVMEVQVKALSQIKKQFVWRRVNLWYKLGNTKPKKTPEGCDGKN